MIVNIVLYLLNLTINKIPTECSIHIDFGSYCLLFTSFTSGTGVSDNRIFLKTIYSISIDSL